MSTVEVEDKVNMIPMIDTMLFLILFFMMVTKFTPEEKAISSLLPTDKGQSGPSSALPSEQIFIAIYPAGMQKGFQPSQYRDQLNKMIEEKTFNTSVYVRVGGADPIEIKGKPLSEQTSGGAAMKEQVNLLHAYIEKELAARETGAASRKDMPPVTIACFTGLSWKYSLLAYDAVRFHEVLAMKGQGHVKGSAPDLTEAREVNFAPPRIRNYSANELGNELYEIIHLR